MVSALPPDCPTLPDGRVLTAALVGMDEGRFSSMFLDGIGTLAPLGGTLALAVGGACVGGGGARNARVVLLAGLRK